jgi:hypothetical protein
MFMGMVDAPDFFVIGTLVRVESIRRVEKCEESRSEVNDVVGAIRFGQPFVLKSDKILRAAVGSCNNKIILSKK